MSSSKGTILGGFKHLGKCLLVAMLTCSAPTSVTGANGGLASAIVKKIVNSAELASYHGLYTTRSSTSGLSAALAAAKGKHAHDVLTLDLASLSGVRRTAAAINARVASGEIPPIRALVLSAGFQDFGKQQWSDETEGGLDMTFAANYLGHWLLALLLLESMDKEKGRIVIIGSQSHE
jgi:NAD(P)-dependent dehydrogenase (short-subunit alcohol dehydrogenase family)